MGLPPLLPPPPPLLPGLPRCQEPRSVGLAGQGVQAGAPAVLDGGPCCACCACCAGVVQLSAARASSDRRPLDPLLLPALPSPPLARSTAAGLSVAAFPPVRTTTLACAAASAAPAAPREGADGGGSGPSSTPPSWVRSRCARYKLR